jgi:hypothetical protein
VLSQGHGSLAWQIQQLIMTERSLQLKTRNAEPAGPEDKNSASAIFSMGFTFDLVPMQKGCRWFVRHGESTRFDRGFLSKSEADAWIKSLGYLVDWRAGFSFQCKGDSKILVIVDRAGSEAKI